MEICNYSGDDDNTSLINTLHPMGVYSGCTKYAYMYMHVHVHKQTTDSCLAVVVIKWKGKRLKLDPM